MSVWWLYGRVSEEFMSYLILFYPIVPGIVCVSLVAVWCCVSVTHVFLLTLFLLVSSHLF